jgi:hypothetical protein
VETARNVNTVHDWWPGLDEVDASDFIGAASRVRPVLALPTTDPERVWFTYRDREEELIAVADRLRSGDSNLPGTLDRAAVVFKHPLPYLYLAPDTLGAAGIPYRIADALPLAAEPVATTVDLVLDAVETAFSRDSLLALLSSPHLNFQVRLTPDTTPGDFRQSIFELNHELSDNRYLGGLDRLESFAASSDNKRPTASAEALQAAIAMARELAPLTPRVRPQNKFVT